MEKGMGAGVGLLFVAVMPGLLLYSAIYVFLGVFFGICAIGFPLMFWDEARKKRKREEADRLRIEEYRSSW